MNFLKMLFVCSLVHFSHTAAECEVFFRISDRNIDLVRRTFQHPDKNHLITLVGMSHWAPPEFYADIQKFIVGKHVIYEGTGDTLDDRRLISSMCKRLAPGYEQLFVALTSWPAMKNPLGQMRQEPLRLEASLSAVNADLGLDSFEMGRVILDKNAVAMEQHLQKLAGAYHLDIHNSVADQAKQIIKQKQEMLDKSSPLSIFLTQKDVFLKKGPTGWPGQQKRIIACKENILNNIKNLLRDTSKKQIVVLFGHDHLPAIAEELKATGWQCTEDLWFNVAHLP